MDLNSHPVELPHSLYFWEGIQLASNKQHHWFCFTLGKKTLLPFQQIFCAIMRNRAQIFNINF